MSGVQEGKREFEAFKDRMMPFCNQHNVAETARLIPRLIVYCSILFYIVECR